MHLHTLNQSPCAETDEKTIAGLYYKNGYNGIVCTNHFSYRLCENYYNRGSKLKNVEYYLDGYFTLKQECEKYGIDVFLGLELILDALDYSNPQPPYAELLVYGISPEWLLKNNYSLFPLSVEEVSKIAKKEGWLLGQSHPFRSPVTCRFPKYLECVEVYNGHPGHQNNNELALELAESNNLIFTAGSNFHTLDAIGSGVYLQNPVKNNEELIAELRKRRHTVFKRD